MLKSYEQQRVKIDEEIFNYRSNVDLRTSQLVRLKNDPNRGSGGRTTSQAATARDTHRETTGGGLSQPGPTVANSESIFSNNYGVSTISQEKPLKALQTQKAPPKRGTTGGPKVNETKPYCNCTLI